MAIDPSASELQTFVTLGFGVIEAVDAVDFAAGDVRPCRHRAEFAFSTAESFNGKLGTKVKAKPPRKKQQVVTIGFGLGIDEAPPTTSSKKRY